MRTGVQPHVRFQVVIAGEALAALFALERLLARVRPFVILQHVLVAERSVADGTRKHLVPRRVRAAAAAASTAAATSAAS